MPKHSLIALLATASLGVAACGDDDESTSSTSTPAKSAAPATARVVIDEFKYMPATIDVAVGAKVTFANVDTAPHTATAKDRSFDTKVLEEEADGTVTVAKAGSFEYFCELHPYMKATLVVR